uniref:hypothetical protein n=1 Tax=Nonomuraea sp. CA-251285 TaxID=3240002 RepID=UPI003F49215F
MGVVKLTKQPGVTPTTYATPDGYTVRRNGMSWSITAPCGDRRLKYASNLDVARQRITADRAKVSALSDEPLNEPLTSEKDT